MKFLFMGTPRSGKSTMLRRLSGKALENPEISPSTGVAEITNVIISKLASCLVSIAKSDDSPSVQWSSVEDSSSVTESQSESTYLDEIAYFVFNLIHQAQAVSESSDNLDSKSATVSEVSLEADLQPSKTEPSDGVLNSGLVSSVVTSAVNDNRILSPPSTSIPDSTQCLTDSERQELNMVFKELYKLFESGDKNKLAHALHTMMNMVDAGGQPAFLDMLPTLTIGPALYGIVFKLNQVLCHQYSVQFCDEDEEIKQVELYSARDVILQSLATIDCFATKFVNKKSVSLLFGTHRDKATNEQLEAINKDLNRALSDTKFFSKGEDLVRVPSSARVAYEVDNINITKESTQKIQNDIVAVIEDIFPEERIPASWMMFYIVLKRLSVKNPTVTFVLCEQIATKLGMRSSLQQALWFFHHQIGSLMYYSDHIESLQNTVICDPQVVYDCVTNLIIEAFEKKTVHLTPKSVQDFKTKGQFCLSDLQKLYDSMNNACGLDPIQLVDILEHHGIVVCIDGKLGHSTLETSACSNTESRPDRKYLMPAILKSVVEDLDSSKEAQRFMIYFQCGFVPFGAFCYETAHLLSHCESFNMKWHLRDIKKNKVSFSIDRAFCVSIVSRLKFQEIQVTCIDGAYSEFSRQQVCSHVYQKVIETLETVVARITYSPFEKESSSANVFCVGFPCCCKNASDGHLMTINGTNKLANCMEDGHRLKLPSEHHIWFKVMISNVKKDVANSDIKHSGHTILWFHVLVLIIILYV